MIAAGNSTKRDVLFQLRYEYASQNQNAFRQATDDVRRVDQAGVESAGQLAAARQSIIEKHLSNALTAEQSYAAKRIEINSAANDQITKGADETFKALTGSARQAADLIVKDFTDANPRLAASLSRLPGGFATVVSTIARDAEKGVSQTTRDIAAAIQKLGREHGIDLSGVAVPPISARSVGRQLDARQTIPATADDAMHHSVDDLKKATTEALDKAKELPDAMKETIAAARDGIEKIARGLVYFHLAREDSIENAARTWAKFEGGVNIAKGGLDSAKAFGGLVGRGLSAAGYTGAGAAVGQGAAALSGAFMAPVAAAVAGWTAVFAWAVPELRRDLGNMIGIFHDKADELKRQQVQQARAVAFSGFLDERQGILSTGAAQHRDIRLQMAGIWGRQTDPQAGRGPLGGTAGDLAGVNRQIQEAELQLRSLAQEKTALDFQLANPFHAFGGMIRPQGLDAYRERIEQTQADAAANPQQQLSVQEKIVELQREKFRLEEQTRRVAMDGLMREKTLLDAIVSEAHARTLMASGDIDAKRVGFAMMAPGQQNSLLRIQGKIDRKEPLTPAEAKIAAQSGYGALEDRGRADLNKLGRERGADTLLGNETKKLRDSIDANNKAEADDIAKGSQIGRSTAANDAARKQSVEGVGQFKLDAEVKLLNEIRITLDDQRSGVAEQISRQILESLRQSDERLRRELDSKIKGITNRLDRDALNNIADRAARRAAMGH